MKIVFLIHLIQQFIIITQNGEDDTFVYTGDIHAMWLRDSGAQVWPYVDLANEDESEENAMGSLPSSV